ncbi:methionyl-tRNA formyltransferase [Desulfonauticus submarinus]|uniref:Methionyl-tRNA formyltransferase n=1 Tax=Desulfonauticus submarinus TaxID=206665 RepID=A0A1H0DYP5_9BACT|nr:methionyl-tRNA formyltransferase [Desulfonauticus submarinus]SDN75208.1 methionyl-tRNA formyltransferase [Desulfonauticus submarinus]
MAQTKKKIVFMGTPEFAATILKYILKWPQGDIVGIYTQPDRPCGRGRKIKCSPVKELAQKHGLPIFQPKTFKEPAAIETLKSLDPDFLVVAAYGLILPKSVLEIPKIAPLNVHASLLPKYRGAAPIQRAILNGEKVTGITIMLMDEGMDTGPILLQRALAIGIDDTAASLHDELANLGGELIVEALTKMSQGKLTPLPQPEERASYAPKLCKEEGLIDFNKSALEVHNQIRGLYPWPGAFFYFTKADGKNIQVQLFPGKVGDQLPKNHNFKPGQIAKIEDNTLFFVCKDRFYLVSKLKPANSKIMDATAFFCGFLSKCKTAPKK